MNAPEPSLTGAAIEPAAAPLLSVRGLAKHFPLGGGLLRKARGLVKAVDGVTLDIRPGETLSLVGESGSGKTTVGRLILRVLEPTAGAIEYHHDDGRCVDVARLAERELAAYRRQVRLVFQDPAASLNPRLTVRETIGESLQLAGTLGRDAIEQRVVELIRRVGLRPEVLGRHPHAFSGGERQRISIARALAPAPRLVVADEALSALDVSVQAQTINLLLELQRELGLAFLFISHDLSVVRHLSDRVAVMYLGRVVETGPVEALYAAPKHPYTSALLRSAPVADPRCRATEPLPLTGEVPDPAAAPSGCAFHPRCPHVQPRCRTETPQPRALGLQQVACHRAEELRLAASPIP
jgi:peptide/nickel transport system ATP-binding protein